jgi:hypothetical protein
VTEAAERLNKLLQLGVFSNVHWRRMFSILDSLCDYCVSELLKEIRLSPGKNDF